MNEKFGPTALACMKVANRLAIEHGHTHISTEHVLLAIAESKSVGQRVLESAGINNPAELKRVIFTTIPHGDTSSPENASLLPTPRLAHAIIMAKGVASKRNATKVDTGDLLCGMGHEPGCTALNLLHQMPGVDIGKIENIYQTVAAIRGSNAKPKKTVNA
ncbi:MAG TPA: Clp protease N-terminal domain-containing protein [Candidatus Nanoarchaeia archaeon]|nr:Clp protease N-terminal domain-containing protein [Candidatus Nanoarchaeia archaeon]